MDDDEYFDDDDWFIPEGLEFNNEPSFTKMSIGDNGYFPDFDINCWGRYGFFIGQHNHLRELMFSDIYTLPRPFFENLMRGVARNTSLNELAIVWCNGMWGSVCEILAPFLKGNPSLTKFTISLCDRMNPDEIHSLSSTFGDGSNSSLRVLDLSQNNISDEMAAELIPSLAGLSQLREIHLRNNRIGRRGCEAMSALLRGNSVFEVVNLGGNAIDDDAAEVLAVGLSENNVLKTLALSDIQQMNGGRNNISSRGWQAFEKVLGGSDVCIKDTYESSNHTLQSLFDSDCERSMYENKGFVHPLTRELELLLKVNGCDDKKAVARQKVILRHHVIGDSSIEPLFDMLGMEAKVLPNILVLIGKLQSASGVFEYVRANATICEGGMSKGDKMKRKLEML